MREIITNLSADENVYAELWARGFVLLVSWDAANAALFEKIRVGARYDEMLGRLTRLGQLAASQPERLALLCTIQETNIAEIVPVVQLAANIGAGLVIFNMVKESDGSPWMVARALELTAGFEAAQDLASQCGISLRLPDHLGTARLRLRDSHRTSGTFCDRPWRELLVRWDCEATVCNMFNPFTYGMLQRPGPPRDVPTRFKRLWSGPNARLFRQLINSEHPHPYCRECYFLHS